ncbi:hypothetical protein V8E55_010024 [Tylopilus felleus]
MELSWFKGNKTAWPMYLTIGNLSKDVCRKPLHHASVLLGYLPVLKLASFANNSVAGYHLFHYCMKLLLQPLMVCMDGYIHCIFPILAAFIRDHPKQCLFLLCNQTQTTQTLHAQATNQYPPEFIANGLRPVFLPFWAELSYTNIFICITSDILHQLHQGIMAHFDAHFWMLPQLPSKTSQNLRKSSQTENTEPTS